MAADVSRKDSLPPQATMAEPFITDPVHMFKSNHLCLDLEFTPP